MTHFDAACRYFAAFEGEKSGSFVSAENNKKAYSGAGNWVGKLDLKGYKGCLGINLKAKSKATVALRAVQTASHS